MIAATACVLVLGGCTGDPEEVVRTSGALADGFEIEPGSGLVGAVFPVALPYGGGHQAVLRVDGDLPRIFEGYVRQAEELGHPLESGWPRRPDGQWCSDPDDAVTDDDPREGPFEVECTASYLEPGEWQVSLRGLVEPDGRGFIHLSTGLYSGDRPTFTRAPDGPAASATDDELASELTPFEEDPVRIVEGSELVSEPFPATCVTGGYIAVLQVTGELTPVLNGYWEQFTSAGFTSEGLFGDDDEPRLATNTAGGGDLIAVGVAGDPSHILIERCND